MVPFVRGEWESKEMETKDALVAVGVTGTTISTMLAIMRWRAERASKERPQCTICVLDGNQNAAEGVSVLVGEKTVGATDELGRVPVPCDWAGQPVRLMMKDALTGKWKQVRHTTFAPMNGMMKIRL